MAKLRDEHGRFIKGSVGNPNGRPPKEREIKFYDLTVSAVSEADWVEIVKSTLKLAKRGDNQARKWLSDYLMGVPAQRMELTGADNSPFELVITYANKAKADE